jgi:zinc protease
MRATRFALVAVFLAWAPIVSAQTVDEVIEKSITAMGGRAAMEKIKTRTMTGTLALSTPAGDIPGTVEVTNAAPNKLRTVIKADLSAFGAGQLLIDQRFDGTAGYMINSMQGDQPITGGQLENMKSNSFPHPFLDYKAKGVKATLSGKEKVGEKDAFVVVFEPATGSPVRQFIDAESFLPVRSMVKITTPQTGEIEQTADSSDFRDVDGVKVPFSVKLTNAMQGVTMTFTKVENNIAVDDKMFVKP